MSEFLERLGIERPIVQAGMGGGMAGHQLAAAVSEAGGLGTIGLSSPAGITALLTAARELTGRPVAANLLLPFARRAHWTAASAADVVVTFWGAPRRGSATPWIHQCGSVDEARAAYAAGADAVIAQGVEAGGHVRGTLPAKDLLERIRQALPAGFPVLLAGGIATAGDVQEALDLGAAAAVAGTRFLMSEESGASGAYKQRLVLGKETLLTELFGLGWPAAPHRVLPNEATDRWLRRDSRGPRVVRGLNRVTAPALARSPGWLQARLGPAQVVGVPFYSPSPPGATTSPRMVEVSPLYAGETVARIDQIGSAAAIVRELTG
jgi:nitronate monooxygenase